MSTGYSIRSESGYWSTLVGQRIQARRIAQGLGAHELADLVLLSARDVRAIEAGSFDMSLTMALAICAALDMSLNDLAPEMARRPPSEPSRAQEREEAIGKLMEYDRRLGVLFAATQAELQSIVAQRHNTMQELGALLSAKAGEGDE